MLKSVSMIQEKRIQTGFTLLELMIVLVIIGLLAGIIGPNLFKNLEKSEKTTARAQVDAFTKAIDQYRLDTGSYPDKASGLQALSVAPVGVSNWSGPYLKKIPLDPWGSQYQYQNPGAHNTTEYDVYSLGKNKAVSSTDQTAYIGNW